MRKALHRSSCRVEHLETRRLLAAAVAYWRDGGAFDHATLAEAASVDALAGWQYQFSRRGLEAALPAGTRGGEVSLPAPDGKLARFSVYQTQLLTPQVAAANPAVRTYRGVGIDDPSAIAHFDLTVNGFHASVQSARGSWAISPVFEYAKDVRGGGGAYASYFRSNLLIDPSELLCEIDGDDDAAVNGGPDAATGPIRYTMRIAVAGNGEWTALAGGSQASGFATIVSAVNTADLLFKSEFSIGLTLVSGTNLVYTNAGTDPYTNSNANTMLGENQSNVDIVIGNANYDIGHVFTTSGGGVASLSVVGVAGSKARGVSGNSPQGSSFQPTFWHEMGHQFGSHHTWNHTNAEYSSQRSPSHAYEPGPGSTIMSYGGFSMFPGNFVPMRDHYYHAKSLERISDHVATGPGSNAGSETPTGNSAPIVNAGIDRVIPAKTPFELTGSGSDSQALLYVWEQYDLGDEDPIGIDDGNGPLFRSRPGISSPSRPFPELADILANRWDLDETLPQVARIADPLTFRLTARDGLGGVNFDAVELTVIDTAAPFAITSQNSLGTSWEAGSKQTVTWNVAGTTAPQFNAGLVSIYLSYDNGATFTPVLSGVSNSGSATFVVPQTAPLTVSARVMVKPDNNIFFDINNASIEIQPDTVLLVNSFTFEFETSNAIALRFDEPIDLATLTFDDLAVQQLPGGPTIPADHFSLTPIPGGGGQEFLFTYNPPTDAAALDDGDYRATIAAGSVADPAGNSLAADLTVDFFVLAGDANRDRTVNLADFNILTANYDQEPRTFSQGDFNYDGRVNLADYNILTSRYGTSLDPDGAMVAAGGQATRPAMMPQGPAARRDDAPDDDALAKLLA